MPIVGFVTVMRPGASLLDRRGEQHREPQRYQVTLSSHMRAHWRKRWRASVCFTMPSYFSS
jgi:hypothetical protein